MCPENRAHTHSLMVEKPFSSSCLRSITAVSLKPPPEPLCAAAPSDHPAVRPSLPTIHKLQPRSTNAAAFFFALNSGRILVIISPLQECRTVEIADREGFNRGLTQRIFRRSVLTGWLDEFLRVAKWEGLLSSRVLSVA